MSPFLGELVGTMILILFGGGVVANVLLARSKGQDSGWIVITTGWGLGVAMAVYAVGWASGAHLNPAVTLALAVLGRFSWEQVPIYMLAQLIGAFLGSVLVYLVYLPHWALTEDPGAKLGVFCTSPAVRHLPANFLTEVIGTATLVAGVLWITDSRNQLADGLTPLLVGFLVWAIGLSLGGPTGYAINPARDLGPRLAHALLPIPGKGDSDWAYAWVPVVGPLVGGVVGALFYRLVWG